MSERRVRSSYDREFKLSAVRLVLEKHLPASSASVYSPFNASKATFALNVEV